MTSEKRMARRKARDREFHAREGPYARWHDRRTWASNNGGRKLERGEYMLLLQFREAHDVASARALSVERAWAEEE